MMRYFFDLHECGHGAVTDHDGFELVDLAAARDHALASARQAMSREVRFGHLCLGCAIVIRDGSGATVMAVPFAEAISITLSKDC